ncbi:MAG TPA: ABC transporter C-terminal domain-containing protein, partial [Chitinophagaceae bacterium]
KGGYEEYVQWKERMNRDVKDTEQGMKRKDQGTKGKDHLEDVPKSADQSNKPIAQPARTDNQSQKSLVKKELQKQQKIFQQLEEKLVKLNESKQQLEAALANPATYSDKNKFLQTENDYKRVSGDLNAANIEYEKVFEKILELERS